MKKLILSIVVLSATLFINSDLYAQDGNRPKIPHRNNIKVNLLSTAISFAPEISYEFITTAEGAVGIKGLFNLNTVQEKDRERTEWDQMLSDIRITPYYRWYFFGNTKTARRVANGFYLEANTSYAYWSHMDSSIIMEVVTEDGSYYRKDLTKKQHRNSIGIGVGLGGQFSTRRNWVFDFGAYLGRNIIFPEDNPIYGMLYISIGKRF